MGDKAEDLLESFNLTDEDAKDNSKVKLKFQGYFDKWRNTIYERARFNTRKQEDETVDEFIADLHRLAKHCGYGTLCDELICDRIVVGIKDQEVSEKLQMKENLTLDDAMTMTRQSEAVKTQQPVVRGEPAKTAVALEARRAKSKFGPASTQHQVGNATTRSAPRPQKCTRYGKSPPHGRQQCPANDAVCHRG